MLKPDASNAAHNDPALNVAWSLAMAVRWYLASSAAPCAFMATSRQAQAMPSQQMITRVTG